MKNRKVLAVMAVAGLGLAAVGCEEKKAPAPPKPAVPAATTPAAPAATTPAPAAPAATTPAPK